MSDDEDQSATPASPQGRPEDTDADWTRNYFNYFTEVEEHFQRARGTGLFLLSPLDWALVESWKNSGVPLEAVLRGIDAAFEKWRTKKSRNKVQSVNSLAYCAQAVLTEAQAMAGSTSRAQTRQESAAPFEVEELRAYLTKNAAALRQKGEPEYDEVATILEELAGECEQHHANLEELEQRLSALEEKMLAIARTRLTSDDLFEARRELEAQLRQYRGKMPAGQLALLERQFLDRRVLQQAGLPRLSLFYIS
jgi:hypothetical protein